MKGMTLDTPRILPISRVPYDCMMFPAEKKSMGFVTEWAVICSRAAAIATGVPIPNPIAMRPMFSMLE